MTIRIFTIAIMALVAGSLVERARADQSFVCSDGSLVQVRAGELDRMKRANACVASHFGIKLAPVPLPIRRPFRIGIRTQRLEPAKSRRPVSSFRHVRIINAGDGEAKWYRHAR